MKDTLKRMLGISQAPAQADNKQEETVEMTTVATTEGAGLAVEMADPTAALTATVAALTAELADKDSKIAELTAVVAAAAEFQAAQAQAAALAKIAARTEKLAGAVGTEQAAVLQTALASLDDAAFDVAVNAMSSKLKVEAQSPAFTEVGVEGSADATKLAAEASGSRVMDYLKSIKHDTQSN